MNHRHVVHCQIAWGVVLLAGLVLVGYRLAPPFPEADRLRVLAASLLVAAVPLFLAILMNVHRRYLSADLIRGYRSKPDDGLLPALLQNTVEQTVANALTIVAISLLAPAPWLRLGLVQAFCFVMGRAAFFIGYARDPMYRFVGFVIGWYIAGLSFLLSLTFLLRDGV